MSRNYLLRMRKAHDEKLGNIALGMAAVVEYALFILCPLMVNDLGMTLFFYYTVAILAIWFLAATNSKVKNFILYVLSAVECILLLVLSTPFIFLLYGATGVVKHCRRHLLTFIKLQRTRR